MDGQHLVTFPGMRHALPGTGREGERPYAFRFNFAQVSTEAILEAVTPEAQILCTNNDLELEITVRGHGIGFWDRLRVEQVLLNLITNAVKFTQAHGRLHLTAAAYEQYWQVSIADEGIGLTEQDLKQVFRPFYRARNAVERDVPKVTVSPA